MVEQANTSPESLPNESEAIKKLRKLSETVNATESLGGLQATVTEEAIEAVMDQNTIPKEDIEELVSDSQRLGLFEIVAFLVTKLQNGGTLFDQETLDFFMNNKQDFDGLSDADSEVDIPNQGRRAIVEAANRVVGSTAFRGPEVDGGNLACAQVASTILKRAGYLDSVLVGVSRTSEELQKKGWTVHKGPGKAGDVVIWEQTRTDTDDGQVKLGHSHIGIVVGNNLCISNWSGKKMPQKHVMGESNNDGYWKKRGIDYYLSPPKA